MCVSRAALARHAGTLSPTGSRAVCSRQNNATSPRAYEEIRVNRFTPACSSWLSMFHARVDKLVDKNCEMNRSHLAYSLNYLLEYTRVAALFYCRTCFAHVSLNINSR